MKSKWLIVILGLSLAVNAGVMVTMGYHYYCDASPTPSAPCPMSQGDSHLYRSLGLSDRQLSKMEPLARSFHGRLAELGAAIEGKKELMIDLLQKDGDLASIEKLRNEMAGIQNEIQNEVIVHITETKKILDTEQQQRLFDLMRQSMVRKSSVLSYGGNG
jgi:Spy/CpxP family protein refolding chaperone